jgi:hypothetical protein
MAQETQGTPPRMQHDRCAAQKIFKARKINRRGARRMGTERQIP